MDGIRIDTHPGVILVTPENTDRIIREMENHAPTLFNYYANELAHYGIMFIDHPVDADDLSDMFSRAGFPHMSDEVDKAKEEAFDNAIEEDTSIRKSNKRGKQRSDEEGSSESASEQE